MYPSHVESKLKNSILYTLTLRVANHSTRCTAAPDSKGLRVEKEGRDLRVGSRRIPLGMSPTKF
jgi:hypothetical protein